MKLTRLQENRIITSLNQNNINKDDTIFSIQVDGNIDDFIDNHKYDFGGSYIDNKSNILYDHGMWFTEEEFKEIMDLNNDPSTSIMYWSNDDFKKKSNKIYKHITP